MRFKIQKARYHDIIPPIRKKRIHSQRRLNDLNKEVEDTSSATNGLGENGNSFFKQNLANNVEDYFIADTNSPIPPFS